jgi:hypothetical protein
VGLRRYFRTALLLSVLGVALVVKAQAENRGDVYRSGFFLAGTLTRPGVVCRNTDFAKTGLSFINSNEFKAFMDAYPKTWKKWMLEGSKDRKISTIG